MWQAGGIRIARIGGIAVDIHLTFGLVLVWGGWQGWVRYGGVAGVGFGVLSVILLFTSVLVHEFGHGLQARAFGLGVERITLLPIGGLAQLTTGPAYPWQEMVIALAGPMANLGVALLLGSLAYLIQPFPLYGWGAYLELDFPPVLLAPLLYTFWVNVVLFFFNMLPAFPMDGGRVIRASLAVFSNFETGTRIAAWLGYLAALAMAALGAAGWVVPRFKPSLLLLVVALMVYFGARHEERYVRRRRALVELEVRHICRPPEHQAAPWDVLTAGSITRLIRSERTVPVVVAGRVVGVLDCSDIRLGVDGTLPATVAHAMRTDFPVVGQRDTLWVALQAMTESQLSAVPVVEGGQFCGMVSLDDIQHAWRRHPVHGRRGVRTTSLSGDSLS